ncbi:hypothetical protein NDU88_006505 [Pleurodeles waltl]|uniref:Secreted protein n=1 Tax=Pleurodeles waltl TaxID=8319 RepID=A0AAV7ULP2_PLEWA|nr:hypothetical protein NDU88_006505 [Pleurodeles waltl]
MPAGIWIFLTGPATALRPCLRPGVCPAYYIGDEGGIVQPRIGNTRGARGHLPVTVSRDSDQHRAPRRVSLHRSEEPGGAQRKKKTIKKAETKKYINEEKGRRAPYPEGEPRVCSSERPR